MVYLICGKICSGKTTYAKKLAEETRGVILSCDEVTYQLFDNNLGPRHDEMTVRIRSYLRRKAVEISRAGTDVILDWGFWSADTRAEITAFFKNMQIPVQWYYISVSDARWQANIRKRNALVLAGESTDYFLDEGLMTKLLSRFEEPKKADMDFWYENI